MHIYKWVKYMDKNKELDNSFSHGVQISERKNLIVTGVKKIRKF